MSILMRPDNQFGNDSSFQSCVLNFGCGFGIQIVELNKSTIRVDREKVKIQRKGDIK